MLFHAMPCCACALPGANLWGLGTEERNWTELEQPLQLCQNISIYPKNMKRIEKKFRPWKTLAQSCTDFWHTKGNRIRFSEEKFREFTKDFDTKAALSAHFLGNQLEDAKDRAANSIINIHKQQKHHSCPFCSSSLYLSLHPRSAPFELDQGHSDAAFCWKTPWFGEMIHGSYFLERFVVRHYIWTYKLRVRSVVRKSLQKACFFWELRIKGSNKSRCWQY